jgi:predicted transport protein
MPLFSVGQNDLVDALEQTNFGTERELQRLVEANLVALFQCRFVATEFPTGIQHGGRIDTLALSEDNNPVIIEYKKVASSELVVQSLYYLAWIRDHKGDFEVAAKAVLGSKTSIVWDDVRVICLAPSYKKFDIHAVQVMGASIELWTYRLFSNKTLYIEEIQQKELGVTETATITSGKNPVMVAAGKKAAASRKSNTYSFEEHLEGRPTTLKELALAVQEYVLGLDTAIEQTPKKFYVAYRTTQNIVCMEVQQKKVTLFLKLNPEKVTFESGFTRDMTDIGHYGTGDVEVTLTSLEDFERAKALIQQAYNAIGG